MLTRAFFAVVVIGCLGIPAAGQFNTGEIAGRVTDATGAVVPGVAVAATHAETGFQRERLTDQSGNFFLPSLPIGELDDPQRPRARTRSDRRAAPRPGARACQRDTVRRKFAVPGPDAEGATAFGERVVVFGQLHAVAFHRRRFKPRRDGL